MESVACINFSATIESPDGMESSTFDMRLVERKSGSRSVILTAIYKFVQPS